MVFQFLFDEWFQDNSAGYQTQDKAGKIAIEGIIFPEIRDYKITKRHEYTADDHGDDHFPGEDL